MKVMGCGEDFLFRSFGFGVYSVNRIGEGAQTSLEDATRVAVASGLGWTETLADPDDQSVYVLCSTGMKPCSKELSHLVDSIESLRRALSSGSPGAAARLEMLECAIQLPKLPMKA